MKWPENIELVLMPGLDGTGIMFKPFLDVLPPGAPVTVVTYPNEDKPLSYRQLVNHAASEIPNDRPIIILAESFSGPIAINLLGRGLPNARGAIFCASFARPPHPFLLDMAKFLPLDLLFQIPTPAPAIRATCFGPDAPSALISLLQKAVKMAKPVNIAARFRMLADIDELSALGKIKIPCCYIQASDDNLVPANCAKLFGKGLADLVVRKINGPHFLLQVRPVETLEVICEFVQGLELRKS